MRTLLLILLVGSTAQAEIFFGPTTATNRLMIASNEVLAVTAILNDDVWPLLVLNGVTNQIDPQPSPVYLVGPCELLFANELAFCFYRLTNSPIRWILIDRSQTNTLEIPAGKAAHFLVPHGDKVPVAISIGTRFFPQSSNSLHPDSELQGPMTLSFNPFAYPTTATPWTILPYYFVEDAAVLPEQRILSAGVGNFEVRIEKSANLTNWFPVVVHRTSAEQKQFYRLRLGK